MCHSVYTHSVAIQLAIAIYFLYLKVKHSQCMNSPPLRPWLGIKLDGTIICAHCNGAGEACSHVAATLYAVMAGVRLRDETSCTSEPCQWLAPTVTKKGT